MTEGPRSLVYFSKLLATNGSTNQARQGAASRAGTCCLKIAEQAATQTRHIRQVRPGCWPVEAPLRARSRRLALSCMRLKLLGAARYGPQRAYRTNRARPGPVASGAVIRSMP